MGGGGQGPGKRVGGALYLHRDALEELAPDLLQRVEAAAALCEAPWSVAKIPENGGPISLLDYEPFEAVAFPALRASHRVSDDGARVVSRQYGQDNPPILHRKELLLSARHPDRARYASLTTALEEKGLFVDMSRRGRRLPWEHALREAGIAVEGHRLVSIDATDVEGVQRHRTAISRDGLSAPMAALHAAGLLEAGTALLDYGCGRGDDVRALQAAGIDATGWDPHYANDPARLVEHPIVNLGFVLNVIEDPAERAAALRSAWVLTGRCLAVAVMLTGKTDSRQARRGAHLSVACRRGGIERDLQRRDGNRCRAQACRDNALFRHAAVCGTQGLSYA